MSYCSGYHFTLLQSLSGRNDEILLIKLDLAFPSYSLCESVCLYDAYTPIF